MKRPAKCQLPQRPMDSVALKAPHINEAEEAIDRAVERVYQMYGPDLSVFFDAVQSQLQLERHEKKDRQRHAVA